VAEQRSQAVLAVIRDGAMVTEVAAQFGVRAGGEPRRDTLRRCQHRHG